MFDEIFLFVKLAETKSIKETAQSLDISNSTVTRSIQKLEAELNIKLFKAHAHHFDLTADGQKIYDHFVIHKRNFINEINSFMQNKDKIRDTLRLALPHSVAELILPSLISWFKDRFPESRLIISYMATSINLLKDGLDLAISRREPASTDHKVSILSRIATKL
ncbi:MAG: LysR family transcriptional regulator [Neisseriales bacterium]|nr:MAG: LysR family transcriptional regulator [Neisseriales bacterium]